jgi:hypothetical protein
MINSERSAVYGVASQPEDTRSNSEAAMTTTRSPANDRKEGQDAMKMPPIVSPQDWQGAREQLPDAKNPT